MKTLVIGAGALGGYFGGRLLAAGRDVTFLVRAKRRAQLKAQGLSLRSPLGDVHLPAPPTVLSEELAAPFDLVLVSCKAYDLEPTIGVPTITVEGDANGAPHLDPKAYASKFTGRHEHRLIKGGIGHNLPQEAPQAFAEAVVDVDRF